MCPWFISSILGRNALVVYKVKKEKEKSTHKQQTKNHFMNKLHKQWILNLSVHYQEYRNIIVVKVLNLSLSKMLTENLQLVCESRQPGSKDYISRNPKVKGSTELRGVYFSRRDQLSEGDNLTLKWKSHFFKGRKRNAKCLITPSSTSETSTNYQF